MAEAGKAVTRTRFIRTACNYFMALTLIKETGAGLVDANSYADVADGNAYHDGHLYATAWTGASDDGVAAG